MRRISPSMLVAVVALVFSCTGGAVAATLITGKQIKDGSIKSKDIASGTIGPSRLSGAVNDLLDEGKLPGPAGPAGTPGPAGAAGPQGPAGPSAVSGINVIASDKVLFGNNTVQSALASCPPGQKVVSGGGISVADEQIADTQATADRTGWFVIGVDLNYGGGEYVQAQALCAGAGQAVAASVTARAAAQKRALAEVAARIAQVEAQVAAQRQ